MNAERMEELTQEQRREASVVANAVLSNERYISTFEDFVGEASYGVLLLVTILADGTGCTRTATIRKGDVRPAFNDLLEETKTGKSLASMPVGIARVFLEGKQVRIVGDMFPNVPNDGSEHRKSLEEDVLKLAKREAESILQSTKEDGVKNLEVNVSTRIGNADLGGRKRRKEESAAIHESFKPAPSKNPFELKTGSIVMLNFLHEDWCGQFRGTGCDCNPDVEPLLMKEEEGGS